MIKSAREFIELRTSTDAESYLRAVSEAASLMTWQEVITERPDMKIWVVRNKTVPIEILRQLASDSDPAIRAAVAAKNKLPADLMILLADDLDESVRERVAYNKNASRLVLEKLANDQTHRISSTARNRLSGEEWPRSGV